MNSVVIVAAKRSAIGNLGGGLASLQAHEIGARVVEDVLQQIGVDAGDIDDVILGQVLTAAVGQNPARQTAIAAGIPNERSAITINQVCGSGLRGCEYCCCGWAGEYEQCAACAGDARGGEVWGSEGAGYDDC